MADLFSPENVISANIAKWEKVGQSYQGVLVERAVRVGSKFDAERVAACYTLLQDDGTTIQVYGKMPVKQMINGAEQEIYIIAGLENAKPGQYVGVKYMSDKENPKGNPTKIVQAFSNGEMKLDVLAAYQKSKAGIPVASSDEDEMTQPEM